MKAIFLLAFCFAVSDTKEIFRYYDTVTLHQKKSANDPPGDLYEVNNKHHLLNKYGEHIGQGDIMFRKGEEEALFESGSGKLKRDALRNPNAKWTGARVPYVIAQANAQAQAAIRATVREFAAKTCIRLVPRTNQRNYVRVIAAGGCYSYVGMIGGSQDLSLGRGCEFKSTAVHEFMHALGFFHEQSRVDRDNHIRIVLQNIQPGLQDQFEKQSRGNVQTFGHPYDFDSVMHYDKYAFSRARGRLPTIVANSDPDRDFGQDINGGLSEVDVKQLNDMYCGGSGGGGGGGATTTKAPARTTKAPAAGLTLAACVRSMRYCSARINRCRKDVFSDLL